MSEIIHSYITNGIMNPDDPKVSTLDHLAGLKQFKKPEEE